MKSILKILSVQLILFTSFFLTTYSYSDNHNIYDIIEELQKDIKTLEKAVYSGTLELNNNSNSSSNFTMNESSEDVLTRHLLKLSEIENQFQELTNKFEEINFKLDKLSNRMSKAQADNQIRFQDLEKSTLSVNNSNEMKDKNDILPGSSQPQDLGSVSYKDT